MLWLGIDVGGTFTDLVLYDEATGAIRLEKTPSTPRDHAEGMMTGIGRLAVALERVERIAHGTTMATNTALERSGARTAVVTTRGFRDVLEVGRGNRVVLYDIKATRTPGLVPRSLRLEVDERTLFDGTVLRAPAPEELERVVQALRAAGVHAVAVCYLHAYANDDNERRTKAAIATALPEVFVSTSSEVLPEYREYERFATTVLNVYVAPRVRRYLTSIAARLAERGYRRPLAVMTSNGGTLPAERVVDFPVHSMLSGPAAGVIGALGRLGTVEPLGGGIRLDAGRARAAVARLAGALEIDAALLADGIVKLAVVKMTGAIKEISIMRGHDPRAFALFAYGGAGPL